MALLDAYGRPVKRQELKVLHAEPGITSVRQAFAGPVASGLTPQRLAGILRACDEGSIDEFMALAEEMEERDAHYASVLGQRKRAISGVVPVVKAASENKRDEDIADWVRREIAEHDGFPGLIEDLMDAIGKGFSAVEIDWARGREWVPRAFIYRPQRFFQFDRETGRSIRLRDERDLVDGVELPPFKYLTHTARLKSGLPFRGGIARVVAFGWMCKAYTLKDWMAFVETYGLPLRLGRYGPSATTKDVEALFRAVANIGTDAAAVLPEGMRIDFIDNKSGQGGAMPIFENLARYVDEQTSKAVLGQTMTTDDGSSMAQAQIHDGVRHDIAAADARAITATINRDLVRPSIDLNFGPRPAYPKIVLHVAEPEDLEMLIGNVDKMAGRGVRFRQAEVRARLGFGDPEDGDEVFGQVPSSPAGALAREAQATARADQTSQEIMDEIEDELADEWQPVMAEMLDPIEAAIAEADSYEDALERLKALGTLPVSGLIEALVKGMFKARSTGDDRDG